MLESVIPVFYRVLFSLSISDGAKTSDNMGSGSRYVCFLSAKVSTLWHGYPSMGEILIVLLLFWCCPGQSIEMLDYDSVQDLSLLLDSADNRNILRRLGRSLGVPPQVIAHLQGFQDLFQYLRTSTYTLLPQLAQAAALLPNPEVVARIHRAVVNKWPLRLEGGVAMTPTVIQYFWPTLHDVTQHVGT